MQKISRNDTTIEPSKFYTMEIIPCLLDEEMLSKQHWEIQSEIFSIMSFIISKLRSEFAVSDIEDITNKIIKQHFNTRKPGLDCRLLKHSKDSSRFYPSLETIQLLRNSPKHLFHNLVAMKWLQCLEVPAFHSYSEPTTSPLHLFNKLVNPFVNIVHTADNAVEATNAVNILKAIVNESEVTPRCEPMYRTILDQFSIRAIDLSHGMLSLHSIVRHAISAEFNESLMEHAKSSLMH